MAARRLLIVMLLLLGISTLAAALVPPPERQDEPESSTSTSKPAPAEPRSGERVAAEVSVSATERPEEIRMSEGDQLALVVKTGRPVEVELPDLGLIEFAEPGAPARFDILVDRDGRYEVTADRAGTVATIVAERAKRQS